MLLDGHEPGDVIAIREVSVTLGGVPSSVVTAVVEVRFKDGSTREQSLEFAPHGLDYATWTYMLTALQRRL